MAKLGPLTRCQRSGSCWPFRHRTRTNAGSWFQAPPRGTQTSSPTGGWRGPTTRAFRAPPPPGLFPAPRFDYRRQQPGPPTVVAGQGWDTLFATAAQGIDVLRDVDATIRWANDSCEESRRNEGPEPAQRLSTELGQFRLLWPYCGQDFQSPPCSANVPERVCAGQRLCPPTAVDAQPGGDPSRPMSQPIRTGSLTCADVLSGRLPPTPPGRPSGRPGQSQFNRPAAAGSRQRSRALGDGIWMSSGRAVRRRRRG